MKQLLNMWLGKHARIPGVFACGLHYADKTAFAQSWAPSYPQEALESTWRTIGESFQVLQMNRLPNTRLRWVYENALLYAARRGDGTCLGVFTTRDPQVLDQGKLEEMLNEFESMQVAGSEEF